MDNPFEVIDLKSGNVLAGFGSEDEALASLRRGLCTHGARAIEDLSLMRITGDDQFLDRDARRSRAAGPRFGDRRGAPSSLNPGANGQSRLPP